VEAQRRWLVLAIGSVFRETSKEGGVVLGVGQCVGSHGRASKHAPCASSRYFSLSTRGFGIGTLAFSRGQYMPLSTTKRRQNIHGGFETGHPHRQAGRVGPLRAGCASAEPGRGVCTVCWVDWFGRWYGRVVQVMNLPIYYLNSSVIYISPRVMGLCIHHLDPNGPTH
jgi:hypothetical protein